MLDIDIKTKESFTDACQRFGTPDVKLNPKKTIVHFVNQKMCHDIFNNTRTVASRNSESTTLERKLKVAL